MAVPIPPFELGDRLLQQSSFHAVNRATVRALRVGLAVAVVHFQDSVQDMDHVVD